VYVCDLHTTALFCSSKIKVEVKLSHEGVKGSGVIAPTLLTSTRDEGEWSASRPCRSSTGGTAPGTHCIWCSVGPRAGLDVMEKRKIFIIIIIITYLNCRWVFIRWQCTTIRHNTQITHITQNNTPHSNKQSTQNYTNNKGHTTHNEYNENTITTTIK
jgi:hypothetical protein